MSNQIPSTGAARRAGNQGCLRVGLFFITILWIVGVNVAAQFGSWIIEQTIFEGSLGIPDFRWLVQLGYVLFLALPLGGVMLLAQGKHDRAIYRTWFLAGLLAVFLLPARFARMTNMEGAALLQIAGLIAHLLVLFFWIKKNFPGELKEGFKNWIWIFPGLAGGFFLMLAWLNLGSLGSPLDVVLGLLVGLLFGLDAALLTNFSQFRTTRAYGMKPRALDVFMDGLTAALTLWILSAAFAQTGTQWMMDIAIPILGWALTAFVISEDNNVRHSWLGMAVLVGLAAAWVQIWFDPDELMLVTAMGNGETISNSVNAAFFALVMSAFLLGLFFFLLPRTQTQFRYWMGISAAILAIGAGAYFILGTPGFYGERLFVIMKDQADLSSLTSIENPAERRAAIYQMMVKNADESQASLRTALEDMNVSYTPYYLVNGLEVSGGPFLRMWLEGRADVDRVLDSPQLRPLPAALETASGEAGKPSSPDWNLTMIEADRVWTELGVTGQGIIVGQSDSGADGSHPELADSYAGKDSSGDYTWYDPWSRTTNPVDYGGHGTHTLGSILGNSVGVAPDAEWIGCVNLQRNLGNPAYYLDCMQFMLAPFPQNGDPFTDGDTTRGAMVINNSWGCPWVEGCDSGSLEPAVHALRTAGIFVVASAGNNGTAGCETVDAPPAIYSDAFSVAAVDSMGQRAMFSSVGPVMVDGSGRVKPDIAAPGDNVLSSFPGGTYSVTSGTSMAGPHIVGVVALMWSANPELIGNIEETEKILRETADPYKGESLTCLDGKDAGNLVGSGIVNAYRAVQRALEYQP